ncbi:Pyruvate/Phosphoenolpyruvate kinase-like domain-containing protein [Exophiala viscosa]|uniref:Pyruvate/Phosphoenolpyruvate kinase-like domain-containing protein n=2 Tax=Exophiala viscosa TaxID=2486360 RepID=A0AAN6IGI3_9EURO|nr:Pyruvate/Phosphoenolpyruvate kinase-like domain-containing protein [Exophiala viscosa]
MATIFPNNLYRSREENSLCKAFGIKLVTSAAVVQIASQAGFDSLFIDLEHSTLSLNDASQLCTAGLLAGITPFVRVPYQCGDGFVQRVLDGGAMGVVFPHVSSRVEAEAAVSISKYPPQGKRSMTGQLPQFAMVLQTAPKVTGPSNDIGSTVFVMIETREGIDNLDDIASVKGVDVLLVGANDLSIELGMPADFENETFQAALKRISDACKKHGKIMGLAGIYDRPKLQKWAISDLGVGFMLGQQDASFITKGAKQCVEDLKALQEPA